MSDSVPSFDDISSEETEDSDRRQPKSLHAVALACMSISSTRRFVFEEVEEVEEVGEEVELFVAAVVWIGESGGLPWEPDDILRVLLSVEFLTVDGAGKTEESGEKDVGKELSDTAADTCRLILILLILLIRRAASNFSVLLFLLLHTFSLLRRVLLLCFDNVRWRTPRACVLLLSELAVLPLEPADDVETRRGPVLSPMLFVRRGLAHDRWGAVQLVCLFWSSFLDPFRSFHWRSCSALDVDVVVIAQFFSFL